MQTQLKSRDQIEAVYTWNAPSVFPSVKAWEEEVERIGADLPALAAFKGTLGQGPAQVLAALEQRDNLKPRVGKVFVYAMMAFSVDTADGAAKARLGRAQALGGQVSAALAFIDPELLALERQTLEAWMAQEPALATYAHGLENLWRGQSHVRSAEVEELLSGLGPAFAGPRSINQVLTNADFSFAPAAGANGEDLEVAQGTLDGILARSDRAARRRAWENYMDTYVAFGSTLTANLEASIQQNVFASRARKHPTTLAAALFPGNIPAGVFHNLLDTFKKNLPTWHRYWALRRRALGVETLHPYDIWAPLSQQRPQMPYARAVDLVCAGMAPLGPEYVAAMRRGCLEERWVDVYPNRGKRAGAFSAGAPGTHPFILMSYTDDIGSLSTLAHELGHSMHSYLTWKHQPPIYSSYGLFVAEVASNFNQALVRAHLYEQEDDPDFRLAIIEEAMANFHRYFFVMPTLARFELEVHQRVERGQGLSVGELSGLMADLFAEGYGGQMEVDRPRVGMTWATFGHLYTDYYVYQYATGISGAHALSRRVLEGGPAAAEDYLAFLQAGSSEYGLELLQRAGVDLRSPQPVEDTFAVLASWVDRLEELLDRG